MLTQLSELKQRILDDCEIADLTQAENDYLEQVTGLNDSLHNPDTDNDTLTALVWDAVRALGGNRDQQDLYTGETPAVPTLDLSALTMTDGYVGRMGKTWETPTQEKLEMAIVGAMQMHGMTREQVILSLESGKALKWQESPNYYYDHSYGIIGRKRSAPRIELVECDCGHRVPRSQVMTTSNGSSCPDCYDRMSA